MSEAAAETAIEVSDVTVRYGDVLALEAVNLRVSPGRICGLVGANGSGKSTLFKTITGQLVAQTGTVRLHGTTPARARRAGLLGYMPQHEAVDWTFPISVREVVATGRYGFLGTTRRMRSADHTAVAQALVQVELTDHAERPIGQLSGGQKKRVFLARALAQQARVLLLDEPFAGVDQPSEVTLTTVLRRLADEGATVLISSHDLAALPDLADEAVLLQHRVLAHGSPDQVLTPRNLAAAFGLTATGAGA
ncbi:metal ABC transporter ATP-binding protein [Kocuria sp. M4R2S49]|uniref:metal ABC transporter ATP-binding protein n=1 Tax=Kocuria rhizosphaericola TaxID=3376284 RepID=UPI0037BD599A